MRDIAALERPNRRASSSRLSLGFSSSRRIRSSAFGSGARAGGSWRVASATASSNTFSACLNDASPLTMASSTSSSWLNAWRSSATTPGWCMAQKMWKARCEGKMLKLSSGTPSADRVRATRGGTTKACALTVLPPRRVTSKGV